MPDRALIPQSQRIFERVAFLAELGDFPAQPAEVSMLIPVLRLPVLFETGAFVAGARYAFCHG
jgi:hypothetical protein